MLRARHVFGLSFAFLVACGSASEGDETTAPGPAPTVAPTPTTPEPVTTTPAPPSGPTPVSVIVMNQGDVPAADVEVVFHDATGTVIGRTKTDAAGKAIASGAAPSMVTALMTAPYSYNDTPKTTRDALTWTNVRPGDVLRAPTEFYASKKAGAYAVALKPAPQNHWRYFVSVGDCMDGTDLQNIELGVWGTCSNTAPGKANSVVVKSVDQLQNVLGYSVAKNVPALGAQPVAVQPDAFQAPISTTFTPLDTAAVGNNATLYVNEIIGSTSIQNPGTASTFTEKPKALKYAPQADGLQLLVWMTQPNGARQIAKRFAPGPDLQMSLGAKLPAIEVGATDSSDPKRPKLGWSAQGSLAKSQGGIVSFGWFTVEGHHSWTIMVPTDATSVQIPALPAELASFEPTNPDEPLGGVVTFVDSTAIADANAFRQEGARTLMIGHGPISMVLPQNGQAFESVHAYKPKK